MSDINLPASHEAERALLGVLLMDGEKFRTLNINGGDFHLVRNRMIFEAMGALHARHDHIDYLTVIEELTMRALLAEVGGPAYITQLIEDTPHSLHGNDYAAIIRDRAQRRRVIQAANELVTAAFNQQTNMDEAIAKAATAIVASASSQDGARPFGEVISELWTAVEEATKNPRDIFGIPTGLAGFDRITKGLQRGEVFMLSGEPGVGKSFLAMQLGVGAAAGSNGMSGIPGAVFELEMSSLATVRRSVSAASRVPSHNMRSGRMSSEDWTRLAVAVETMGGLPVYISDRTDWTTTGIRAECARLKTHGIGWVIIDYLALLKDGQNMDEIARSGIISDRVHDIAKDMNLAVVAIHDMTKAGMTGQVSGQAGLSGSRRVSYNADMTAFLRSTDDVNLFNLEWAKFREDSSDRFLPLRRVPGFPAYAEIAN